MKFNINENIKPNIPIEIKTGTSNTTSTQWFLSHLMKSKSEYQPLFGELLLIAEPAVTLPVSTAWPERGASALKIVKNSCRSRLQNDMLEAMFHVKINGPALGSPKMESLLKQAVEKWLSKKNRKKLPSTQHALLTTTEAPLPVHIPKEVADPNSFCWRRWCYFYPSRRCRRKCPLWGSPSGWGSLNSPRHLKWTARQRGLWQCIWIWLWFLNYWDIEQFQLQCAWQCKHSVMIISSIHHCSWTVI